MKKKNFKVKKFGEPKVTHETKHDDLITQYNRMRSIANDIYNSDFFAMATKKEQKEIEASVACISKTLISMIGLDAIDRADYLPDDSGDADRSWSDNLPDDSGNGADTNKERHDAIKKIMNIAYGKTKANGMTKAAARQTLNSVYGAIGSAKTDADHAPSSIVAMNREILGGLSSKSSMRISPMQTLVEVPSDDDSDDGDEVKDHSEVNLGNFIEGSSYGWQYLDICRQYGFDTGETLKQIEELASQYHIQTINLVDIVEDRYQIKPDGKYDLKPGDIFFVINKKNCKNPFFLLIYTKSLIESNDFHIDLVSTEIIPVKEEESAKTNDIELINPDLYFNIGKPNSDNVIDLNASLDRIKDAARNHGIDSITFTGMIWDRLDIYDDRYSLKPGSLFYFNGGPHLTDFLLVTEVGDTPDATRVLFIESATKPEENASLDDIDFVGSDAYYNIDNTNPNYAIDLDATLIKIKEMAKEKGIKTITFVDSIGKGLDIFDKSKYSLKPGSLFYIKRCINLANFILVTETGDAPSNIRIQVFESVTKSKESTDPVDLEESTKTNNAELTNPDTYSNIDKAHVNQNAVIDLDETLNRIKDEAMMHGINSITFVGTVENCLDIYDGKHSLEPGSLFYIDSGRNLTQFILVTDVGDTPGTTRVRFIDSIMKPEELDNLNGIEFVGIDAYYNIDNPNNDIDLNATLIKIKEKAKEKGIKTITFVDTIKDGYHILGKYSFELGSLFFVKNTNESRFNLVNDTNPTTFQYIYPVMTKKDDSEEDSSDSKEDDIEVVKDEDEETVGVSSDKASSDYVINQYADADTSELDPDVYAVAFPIFMKPTDTGTNVSFADICNLYDFDISETVKRIKNAAYLEKIEEVNYIDSFQTLDDIFKTEMSIRYGYYDGSLFLVRESTKGKLDPYFVILRKQHDDSYYDAYLYRINPIMRPAKIHGIKKIDIIDTYADGDVRIANDLKNLVDIYHTYRIKEICDKRNYDYNRISNCLEGVTAIIGGGARLTFEGTVDSLNSIVLVDPAVAYDTCSVFFVRDFIDGEEEPYFVIYMPITGKTKNGYNFRLYRINPIPNLNQDLNTDSQDGTNVREINQFTSIFRANLEVGEADKDDYMKVEFSRIHHGDDGAIQSVVNICTDWKFKVHDTIKRIRLVAYRINLKEIKFAGTACSHEEILEKEVLYSDGSVVFVSDAEDPHFVIVEIINGSTCLNRINPVKE